VVLALLMLATDLDTSRQNLSSAAEPQSCVGIFNFNGKGQSGFADHRVNPHGASLYPLPRALYQISGQKGAEPQVVLKMYLDMTADELAKALPELKHLKSADSQDMLPMILTLAGGAVADFFENFSNTTCTEHVNSIVSTPLRNVAQVKSARFNYLALVKPGADKTSLQELRTDSKGDPVGLRTAVVTIGFVAMAAYFHPAFQRESRFRYLGRELLNGQSTYVVAFAQRSEMARLASRVMFGDDTGFVFMQGVAWIDPVSFRILRLRTDIEQPELAVGLQRESTEVEYSEVTFMQGGKTLWLPHEVTVKGQLRQYTFHNRHRYSDYRLFVVQTEQKQKSPSSEDN
jgi:hypothetical protein